MSKIEIRKCYLKQKDNIISSREKKWNKLYGYINYEKFCNDLFPQLLNIPS